MPQRGDLVRFINDQQVERVGICTADQPDEQGDINVVPLAVLRVLLVQAIQQGLIMPITVPHAVRTGGASAYWATGGI